MDNPKDNELIEIIARNILDILKSILAGENDFSDKEISFLHELYREAKLGLTPGRIAQSSYIYNISITSILFFG